MVQVIKTKIKEKHERRCFGLGLIVRRRKIELANLLNVIIQLKD